MMGVLTITDLSTQKTDSDLSQNFQDRVTDWLVNCFGKSVTSDRLDRTHRFLEEALELAQAGGCSREDAIALLSYVFSRPKGELASEIGGVMVTLAGVAQAHDIDMQLAGEDELARNRRRTAAIREKHLHKPQASPLPQ